MGNTESTVRRITLKKDHHDDRYIENMIITERLANVYMNPNKEETTKTNDDIKPTITPPQHLQDNLRHQQLNYNTKTSGDFYNKDDQSIIEHMKYLGGVLTKISRRLDRQFVEINEKIRLQSEAQLNTLQAEKKEYHIANPFKEDMEQIAECFEKHPNQPLKCRNISHDFLYKSYNFTAPTVK